MITNFQCDKCHSRNIQGGDSDSLADKDVVLMVVIRRATLDYFWSRGTVTIKGNLSMMKR